MRSSSLGIYHPGGVFHPSATYIGQFDKLTDRTEGTLVPELAEGASPNSLFIPSFTHLAPNDVFFIPCLCFCFLPCKSVANLHNKTNYALYLNNNLGFIIKNHHGGIR